MDIEGFLIRAVGLVGVLVVALVCAKAGGLLARWLRQPEVIGEIVAGLLIGPAAVALMGKATFGRIVVDQTLGQLKPLAEIGLVLYLVGEARQLRLGRGRPDGRTTAWVAAGAFVVPLLAGAALAAYAAGDARIRGHASTVAFGLMVAVSLAVTAVPVLARILSDWSLRDTPSGRLAFTAAIVIDTGSWLLLLIAIGAAGGGMGGFLRSMAVLAGGALLALALGRVLRTGPAKRASAALPRTAALLLGIVAVAVSLSIERLGLTAVLGAVLVGLAIPAEGDSPWQPAVAIVTGIGRALVPIFFVVTGITVLTRGLPLPGLPLVALTTLLGLGGKLVGGYVGSRLGGQHRLAALRVGVLMNTRGLTELIVLQAGYSAGILTAPLFLALVVMALVTTALTGPLLRLLHRVDGGEALPAEPVAQGGAVA